VSFIPGPYSEHFQEDTFQGDFNFLSSYSLSRKRNIITWIRLSYYHILSST